MAGPGGPDGPTVSLSFANNFWGKEDAGVSPLLERMHNSKITGDELKAFYTARSQIEDDYARKLLNLARKPLGSSEAGTLRMSLDVLRGEVEVMGKAHQQVATQMRSELEEPLSAFTGGIKERRKIVQHGVEKLLKTKTQQTTTVNKTRDKYEQDCLKIKGYLAQGHMVMGQEERKNKAKLEKTQIQLSQTSNEYEAAVKALEDTTIRWNRDWKAACDKFQDLEEERIDFMKSSLWSFANIASTVCVGDDASCEKVRLSLEDCDVEKDIVRFIKDQGTGQEIPDPPKFINFCRGDVNDTASEQSDEGAYSVAQFQRAMNPAFRTSSPQPSTLASQHGAESVREDSPSIRRSSLDRAQAPNTSQVPGGYEDLPQVPHNEYPPDGMTQFCRIGPPSDRSSIPSPTRTDAFDDRSEYSNPTSHSSYDPASGHQSPTKQLSEANAGLQKKKSGFFQHSPFHRKRQGSNRDTAATTAPTESWPPPRPRSTVQASSPVRSPIREAASANDYSQNGHDQDPVDTRASFQLNVGKNVFGVASPDRQAVGRARPVATEDDPIAQALADLKNSTVRISADRYHGLSTPTPTVSDAGQQSRQSASSTPRPHAAQASHGGPPPTYQGHPSSRLGAPAAAFTSKQMQQTTAEYVRNGRPAGGDGRMMDVPRAASPAPVRTASPQPYDGDGRMMPRATSPRPYSQDLNTSRERARSQSNSPNKMRPNSQMLNANQIPRARSPQPRRDFDDGEMSLEVAQVYPTPDEGRGRGSFSSHGHPRPTSQIYGDGPYSMAGPASNDPGSRVSVHGPLRDRKQSVGAQRKVTRDGRPILHFSRAIYMYQAAIPEELSFNKGDVLAVLRHQDDGWWEAELTGANVRPGLVPSNYLKPC